jgi:hypothetical protein
MADWLDLHGLTPATALHLLEQFGPSKPAPSVGRIAFEQNATTVWQMIGSTFGAGLRDTGILSKQVMNQTRTQFAPDPVRFARAFTLHDAGDGRPFVSCLYRGTLQDAMTMAHEFGHAAQILASGPRVMSPVLRETCAFLAERWFMDQLRLDHPNQGQRAQRIWAAQTSGYLGKDADALRLALGDRQSPYDYTWNYPLARGLAMRLTNDSIAKLFAGHLTLPEVAASFNA